MNLKTSFTTVRTKRRLALLAAYSVVACGVGVALSVQGRAPAAGRGGGATVPATRPTNTAGATAQVAKARTSFEEGVTLEEQGKRTEALAKYAQAKSEITLALQMDPTHSGAILLRDVLDSRIASATPGGTGTGAARGGGTVAHPPRGSGNSVRLLDPSQISMLRVMEVTRTDRALRGTIERPVLEDFWANVALKMPGANSSAQARNVFMSNFSEQVQKIRESGERKYLEQINLTSDPASLVAFNQRVHPYVLQNCATAECHGGGDGGTFQLAMGGNAPQEVMYTNFYIMSNWVGTEGGKMIDRDVPENSLFLQYSLAGKHPKVDVRKLASTTDARFRTMADWIRTLSLPRPVYNIAYEIPGMPKPTPATAPATAPATGPRPTSRGRG